MTFSSWLLPGESNMRWYIHLDELCVLSLENSVLNNTITLIGKTTTADLTIKVKRSKLNKIIMKKEKLISEKEVVSGDIKKLKELMSMLDKFDFYFNIVTPNMRKD